MTIPPFLQELFSKMLAYGSVLVVAALSLFAYGRGKKKEGKQEEELEAAQEAIEIVKEAKAVHEEVNNYSDDDHIDLLQK